LKAWWLSGKLGVGAELLDHLIFVEICCLRFRILVVIVCQRAASAIVALAVRRKLTCSAT